MTRIPDKFSLIAKFNLSINCWTILNLGIAIEKVTPNTPKMTMTTKKIIHVIDGEFLTAFIIPPIPLIGASIHILTIITRTIWIWTISFVLRVIKEAVENLLNSLLEKLSTFLNTAKRKSLATAAPSLDAKNATQIEATAPSKAIPNIWIPLWAIYWFCTLLISAPSFLYSALTPSPAAIFIVDSPIVFICLSMLSNILLRSSSPIEPMK